VRSRPSYLVLIAAAAVGVALLLDNLGWLQPHRPIEFCGLILAGILISALAAQPSATEDRATMPPSFVIEFAALLIFGAHAALVVAIAGAIARGVAHQRAQQYRRTLMNVVTVSAATQAAGFAHHGLGGTLGHFEWPLQAIPIAAALVAYVFVKVLSAEVARPLLTKQPVYRSWPARIVLDAPIYFTGAGVAVGFVEIIDHRIWELLPVAAIPLYCALRTYGDYVDRLDAEHRRREVIESLDQGMCVVDSSGRLTLWNDTLERIAGVRGEQALGDSLVGAIPALGATDLPRALADALKDRTPRMVAHFRLSSAPGARILQIKMLPVTNGIALLWQDVTERTRIEQALKRNEERLALAAEGANDGWWEWDLRSKELFCSARWRELVGLAAAGGIGRPEDWLDRVHPDDVAPLKDALKAHLSGKTPDLKHEHRLRHEDGTYRWFLCRGVAGRTAGRTPTRLAGSLTDTTDRGASSHERLRTAGFRDPLTGLRSRADFVEVLGRRLEEFKQPHRGGGRFAILYLDLDRFKVVNDNLGHLVGDELLVAVSRRLEACLRPGDALARLGGDEFAILLQTVGDEQLANVIAFQIQEALSEPIMVAGREVFTSASIGICFGTVEHSDPDEIMRDADTAMYHAKAHGKARHELFDADMHARTRDRLDLENDLRHAVSNQEFEVHYQPIVLLGSGMCVGFESLIRWTRNGKPVSPVTFVPMAEELGLIEPLGTWVLQQACQTFADWQRRHPGAGLDYITVNVSSRQLMQQNFIRIVEQAVESSGLKPCDLRLEITETALMDSPSSAAELLQQLRSYGTKIYLDDFGTGYSSLSHLHKLPVDALKIDRSFVKSLALAGRPAIVESILALARTMKTSVVAEGIETDVQAHELERLGCTHAQGFLFSRPLSAKAAEELIVANQPLGPKRVQPTGTVEADPYYTPPAASFKWPEHIPPRRTTLDPIEEEPPILTGRVN
jgi:diguanylate cyclase (GGDEF)-like protein/PAS domain S-box-containing protein